MSFDTCAIKVKQWFKENGDEKVKMPDTVVDQMARLLDASGKDAVTPSQFQQKMQLALQEYTDRMAAKFKATAAMDAVITTQGVHNTLENTQTFQTKFGMDADKANKAAFEARIMGGENRPGVGTSLNVRGTRQSLQTTFLNFMHKAFGENENALMTTDKASQLTRDIIQEKWALENKTQLGLSNNPLALEIAKGAKGYQNRMMSELKAYSPFMEEAKNFIVSQNYNREAVVGDGSPSSKAAFVSKMMDRAGDTSFIGNTPEEKIKIFQDMYEKIRAGTYKTPGSESHFWGVPGTGGDLARKMAPARTVNFKDWQSVADHTADYGDDLYSAFIKQSYQRADQIAKISKWGSRAADNFQKEFYATARTLPEDQQEAFMRNQAHFKDMFDASMASNYAPAVDLKGRIAQGIMNVNTAALAGMHVPRSLNDFQNIVSQSRDAFGKTLVENTHEMAGAVIKALSNYPNSKELLGEFGVFQQTMHRENMPFMDTTKPGMTAKAAEMVGKYSGANAQQTVCKTAMATIDAKNFGDAATSGNLPATAQAELARYNIGPHEWEFMRGAKDTMPFLEGQTRNLLTPEAIRNMPNENAELYLRKSGQWTKDGPPPQQVLDRAKYQVAMNYGSLLNDRAGSAAANLNERQRYALFGNPADPNDGKALLTKMLWQFKAASVANFGSLQRGWYSGATSKSNIAGLAQRLIMGGIYYTLGDYAIQAATGKTLQDPTSPEMLSKFAIGSGGTGIWSDGLVNALEEHSGSDMLLALAKSAAGPGVTDVGQVGVAGLKTLRGAAQYMAGSSNASFGGPEWEKAIQSNTPGQNIPYLKAGMNYLLFNELHEIMGSTGYLENLRKQIDKNAAWPESLGGPGGQQSYTFGDKNFWGQ